MEKAILGGGCFWCLEAIFEQLEGVESVVSGYCGGESDFPRYESGCSGATGHAEVVEITFDPQRRTYRELLDVFFQIHDPTTLNRQGNDSGTQYRSVIFAQSQGQKAIAWEAIKEAAKSWIGPIVTEIQEARPFFPAESYHQGYFRHNGRQPYCSFVVAPKLRKFRQQFSDQLKPDFRQPR